MTVLIVDDDDNVLTALRLLLKSEGLACVTCRSPQQALETLRTQDCQLALVDLNYVEDTTSGKEGLRLISALRAADEELPIIAMTGWARSASRSRRCNAVRPISSRSPGKTTTGC